MKSDDDELSCTVEFQELKKINPFRLLGTQKVLQDFNLRHF